MPDEHRDMLRGVKRNASTKGPSKEKVQKRTEETVVVDLDIDVSDLEE